MKRHTNTVFQSSGLNQSQMGLSAHQHEENDEVFYGIKGIASVLLGDKWVDVEKELF